MRVLFVSTRITRLVHHSWYFHHLRLEKLWHARCQKAIPYCQTDEEKVPHDGWHWVHLFKNICRVCPRWVSSFLFILGDLNTLWFWSLLKPYISGSWPKKEATNLILSSTIKDVFLFSQPNSYIEACRAFFGEAFVQTHLATLELLAKEPNSAGGLKDCKVSACVVVVVVVGRSCSSMFCFWRSFDACCMSFYWAPNHWLQLLLHRALWRPWCRLRFWETTNVSIHGKRLVVNGWNMIKQQKIIGKATNLPTWFACHVGTHHHQLGQEADLPDTFGNETEPGTFPGAWTLGTRSGNSNG